MSYTFEEGKTLLIDAVISRIMERMPPEQAVMCSEFVRQFYGTAALEDLRELETDDLYGAAVNLWSQIATRASDTDKVCIYNPDFECHGWQTTHTVIQVVCRDMPFLVDSLRMIVNRMGFASHLIIHMGGLRLTRNAANEVTAVWPREGSAPKANITEAVVFIEIDRQTDSSLLEELHRTIEKALEDNRAVVDDWSVMRERVREAIVEMDNIPATISAEEVNETRAFLQWIEDHHFTFLGVRDYELCKEGQEMVLRAIPQTGLGVLRATLNKSVTRSISSMTPQARELTMSPHILVVSKTNTLATVHRDVYTDYIGIKRFDKKGKVIGERRIIGLYTSAAYNTSPRHIPFLRHKVANVMTSSHFDPKSHAGKVLLNILETLPRDDLIQGSEAELLEISMGIFYMQERRRIRLFARMDVYRRFISCLVYVPKERYTTLLRQEMEEILRESFNATEISFYTRFSESVLARIHFIVRLDPEAIPAFNLQEIEKKLIEAGRSWTDDLQHQLGDAFGEETANQLFVKYRDAFPIAYSEMFSPRTAVYDIRHVETLTPEMPLGMNFYRPVDEPQNHFRLKVYQHDTTIPLSDVLPIVERLGLRAISERPYVLKFKDGKITWINEFALEYTGIAHVEADEIRERFQNAFARVWFGDAENDGFNQLVLAAGLDWRQVSVLRTYARYFRQIGFTFSQDYIEHALNNNPALARKLVELFELRFVLNQEESREERTDALAKQIIADLDAVTNLDEDRIIRQYVHTILATLRTNYYQMDKAGNPRNYISIKLNSRAVPGLPKPMPLYEIFMCSPRVEGVHLRGGKVARGGLRWSDRREDFRTEILGLMKAQQVKNSVIVPSGAKGGFVPKQMPANPSREDMMAEGILCYRLFIRSLLDITDNYVEGKVQKPAGVVCHDGDDPYLVVAADKGTATFSDIANEISHEYGFWLGDAFASGGSVGYDHKKMGITARGAWESVKRHFTELDIDIQKTDFTVVGIGDMSGDVFGNGMLLSPHIQLVAAFNHQHIFIDPNPDAKSSFVERQRLFNLPRSTWDDYDKKRMSKGGGVFLRSAKSIPVSPEMKARFDIDASEIEPNELIRAILRARIDLLWSAGIGTFVKASTESNADVGDRTNDATRVNANTLRCRVVGEGGNLGLTQLARMEYALEGGRIYTDFIDNSAGVHCSDKEVNIKILLNAMVAAGDLTLKQRNELLSAMTDEVAALVLRDNYLQPRAISLVDSQGVRALDLQRRYINELEQSGKLDRAIEFLPDEKSLIERKLLGKGLGAPAIAVLMCYTKTILKEQILASDVPEDPFLKSVLFSMFPKALHKSCAKQMEAHPLRREIIATKLSNIIVNEMGFTFVYRLQDETGAPVSAIVRAFMIARAAMDLETIWEEIQALDGKVSTENQNEMMMTYVRLMRRTTRWFLRNLRTRQDITHAVAQYAPGLRELKATAPVVLGEGHRAIYQSHYDHYLSLGVPPSLTHELTITRGLFAAMDLIDISQKLELEIPKVSEAYFWVSEFLELAWIRSRVIAHPTENQWESLSREALRDDLDWQHRQLTAGILQFNGARGDFKKSFEIWATKNEGLIERWKKILADLRAASSLNYTMFFVAIRELLDLTQTTVQMSEKMTATE
ncbi:NAD-glutamate dehydrogenase [Legionella geestiana]|uniref:NAD-glutamate dehydrogenase n=1 Tax=Legionella geestiana TaxID=45065 RepID=A0A0W0TNQ4_9GAMM|nr:NAD-glutamate dehydrogenase [Legionella geestiana]KTC97144.1 NAD-glutamate dehydrogenase [Legionella geestiana]QBS11498.1 NAD-glutamate dehydrogenase [Legionella geestiana]STX53838.1 NAD-glutamate dehydrogenase [Legionella geestiana]